jgi:hypothetical protein
VTANTAPSFVANSSDELVPVAQVQQYVAALQRDHVDVQFVELPGTLHAIQYGNQVWGQTMSFLQQQLTELTTPSTTAAPPTSASAGGEQGAVATIEDEGRELWPLAAIAGAVVVIGVVVALVVRRRRAGRAGAVSE